MNRRFVTFVFSAFLTSSWSASCDAGPLLDWLFNRNRRVAYYPNAGCCGPGYCEQTVVRYVPQVAYRTVWQPVPVTTYRRTSYSNPQTGLPITCTRPCTTYTYQARRVPYTTYRPVYTKVPMVETNYQTFSALPSCSSCSTGFASNSYAANGYDSPTYSTPSESATPWRRSRDSEYDSDAGGSGESEDYGDRIPTREPQIELPNEEDDTTSYRTRRLSRIPSTSTRREDPYYRSRYSSTVPSANPQPEFAKKPRSQDSRSSDQRNNPSLVREDRESDAANRVLSRHTTLNRARAEINDEKVNTDIKPIPNIDPPSRKEPGLLDLNRTDREASHLQTIPTRWASNRIPWNRVIRASYQRPVAPPKSMTNSAESNPLRTSSVPKNQKRAKYSSTNRRIRDNRDWHSSSR